MYIYHNTIDAVGDDAQTERKVFSACEDAVEEISALVKLLVKEFRAPEVLVTADHGFLYTAKPLSESEHAAASDVVGKVVECSRRYEVAHQGASSDVLLRAKLPGKEHLEAFFPRECVRLHMPGAGENYVHGGISLQEMCVPVVRFRNRRAGSRGYVAAADAALSSVSLPSAVANPSFNVELLQDEASSGKVLPAEYEVYVEGSSGRAVSNRARVFADIELADASRRVIKVRIDLLTSVSFDATETYRLVARNVRTGESACLGELHIHLA
ncbi:PglZ domain-containing protein [Paratractidigestivibacter sp.]|uniref:PglZ domain-containing protein n=1 Tax=Paratractidigestivibacter sp. TaxID=2847316 RepID=UPI002AC8C9A5|nr:PglZ domain-containing protein [Paratractidigestivibacter sp.]